MIFYTSIKYIFYKYILNVNNKTFLCNKNIHFHFTTIILK